MFSKFFLYGKEKFYYARQGMQNSLKNVKTVFQKLHLLHRSTLHIIRNANINLKISRFIAISREPEF